MVKIDKPAEEKIRTTTVQVEARCSNCIFHYLPVNSEGKPARSDSLVQCRINPPTAHPWYPKNPRAELPGFWPMVYPHQWCSHGKFKKPSETADVEE